MNTILNNDNPVKIEKDLFHHPAITLLLPLDKTMLAEHLKELTQKLEKELTEQYDHKARPVIEKLRNNLSKINFNSGKKSVVVFVSPVYDKTIYLDIPLEEKIMVDEHFEIRDLVNSLYPADKYLLLVQSAENFKIFLGDLYHLMKIKVNIPDNIAAYKNDLAEKIEYFTDTVDRKEVMLDKFIHHIDKELENLLNKYRNLPVFIIGPERMNGHYKKYTHNEKSILEYIHGNYDDAKPHQLLNLLQPYLKDLKIIENSNLATKIEHAQNANKFSFGIEEVWRNVMAGKGKLLLVERNFSWPHNTTDTSGNLNRDIDGINDEFVKDAVDILIEKVLETGGEVKFVDTDLLSNFQHIGLALYY